MLGQLHMESMGGRTVLHDEVVQFTRVLFENHEYFAPGGYEKYLTQIFGDYMKLHRKRNGGSSDESMGRFQYRDLIIQIKISEVIMKKYIESFVNYRFLLWELVKKRN